MPGVKNILKKLRELAQEDRNKNSHKPIGGELSMISREMIENGRLFSMCWRKAEKGTFT